MEQDMSRESAHYTMCLIICYLLPVSGRIGLTEVHFTLICEGACGPKYISANLPLKMEIRPDPVGVK